MIDQLDQQMMFDTTGDGLLDTQVSYEEDGSLTIQNDYDGDGNFEQVSNLSGMDYWGNPTDTTIMLDTDADGNLDTGVFQHSDEAGNIIAREDFNDYNQDGEIDMSKTYVDTNGDGMFDMVTTIHTDNSDPSVLQTMEINLDQTGDQNPDVTMQADIMDTTGNGQPDMVELHITDAYGQEFSYEMTYEEYMQALNGEGGMNLGYDTSCYSANLGCAQFDPAMADPEAISGDPVADMEHWEFQGQTNRCAIYAQKFAIEEAIGREVPIEELVSVAEENGWFDEASGGGTTRLNMDKLLEYYGVEHEMSFNNDIQDIEEALNNGQNVIVGVDSGQIWQGDPNNIFSPETQADHAVQVIGIDHTDPNNPMVILNDSGSPEGCGELVPLDVFENAWKAGDAQMVVCNA